MVEPGSGRKPSLGAIRRPFFPSGAQAQNLNLTLVFSPTFTSVQPRSVCPTSKQLLTSLQMTTALIQGSHLECSLHMASLPLLSLPS